MTDKRGCLDDETLHRLARGELTAARRKDVVRHLDGCGDCRALAALAMSSDDDAHRDLSEHEVFALPTRQVELGPGEALGRYEVVRRCGSGAMGVVYEARDPVLDRPVALKILHGAAELNDKHRARLRSEARSLARLAHPNVVAVYDVGEEQGRLFLAMEFIDGPALDRWVRDETQREIVRAYRQVAAGLYAAHEAGLIHRDLKPSNVLVDPDGGVRVTDFGLAADVADLGAGPDAPRGLFVGTPAYASPEQLALRSATPASDQYSFCVCLCEALTGFRPTPDDPRLQPPVDPRFGALPRSLRKLLSRGLQRDPAARHPSMRHLLERLHRVEARSKRLVSLVAVAVSGIVAAGLYAARAPSCEDTAASADPVSAEHTAAIVALSDAAAISADEQRRVIDDFSASWRHARATVCHRERDAATPSASTKRTMRCLREHADIFETIAEVAREPTTSLRTAAHWIRLLDDPRRCLDLDARTPMPEAGVERELTRLRRLSMRLQLQADSGDAAGALQAVERESGAVEATGYPVLIASWRARRAALVERVRGTAPAVAALEDVYAYGIEHRVDGKALWAAATLMGAHVKLRDMAAAEHWAGLARALLDESESWDLQAAYLRNRALLLRSRGDLLGARAALQEALGKFTDTARLSSPNVVAVLLYELGGVAFSLGDKARAREHIEDGISHAQRRGVRAVSFADALRLLAEIELSDGELVEAEGLMRQVVEINEATLPPAHRMHGANALVLGRIRAARGDPHGALELYEDALLRFPEDDPHRVLVHGSIARVLRRLGRFDEARREQLRVVAELQSRTGERGGPYGSAVFELAESDRAQGRVDEAIEGYRRALSILEDTDAEQRRSFVLLRLGEALLERGAPKNALGHLTEAARLAEAAGPGADSRQAMAEALRARAQWDLASTHAAYAQARGDALAALDRWPPDPDFDRTRSELERWVQSL